MMDVNDEEGHRIKRFKHQSYNDSLKQVHLTSALNVTQFDHDIDDNDSHFHETLVHWRQLNLAPSFLSFASQADPLSASMPLLLHNWRQIIDIWVDALNVADDEGMRALFDLLQKLTHDLRSTISPAYTDILGRLLAFLPRTISAAALSALLETLSTLFKFLLIPVSETKILEETWSSISQILRRCLPEVQRAIAEVWGSVLRRLKVSTRGIAVTLMAGDLKDIEDACAWMIVFACKSVSQTLHTAATSIISPLITYYVQCENSDIVCTLTRRVLTALIHHVKNADQFSAVGDVIVQQFYDSKESEERLRRMLQVVSVVCAVRKGTRLSAKQLSLLVSEFPEMPMTDALRDTHLQFATAALIAGDMALWMGPGRRMVERAWEYPDFGIALCGALAELGWGGWKLIIQPTVLRMTAQLLEKEPKRTLGLLAVLHREKKLSDVDLVWRQKVDRWVTQRLLHWEKSQESVLELADILALSSYLPSISSPLVQIVETMLKSQDPKEDYEESYANSAWVLGSCMQGLSRRDSSEWLHRVDIRSWTRICVEKWGWSDTVLNALVLLSTASSSDVEGLALEDVYPLLQGSVVSHSRPLRLSSLRLLDSPLINVPPSFKEVVKRCLQGEEVSLDTQGVRERVLRIGRVGQVVKDGDDIGADLCVRWLVAQLKVNLRPLWSPASSALASLSQRFGDLAWGLVFGELKAVSLSELPLQGPHWLIDKLDDGQNTNDPWEEERSWRDPSAHAIRTTFIKWVDEDKFRIAALRAQTLKERLDLQTYYFQLLNTLGECSSLAEKHNRELVPMFLSLVGPDAATKLSRQKLSAWLTLFGKFGNPKALYLTETLHALYVSLLSHPDRSLQTLSLTCLFTYKSPHLVPNENRIRVLLDDTRWRDELSALDLANVEGEGRGEFVDVIIRLLFGMMLEKKGRTRGADRRVAVLGALAGCTDEELGILIDLMLRPIKGSSSGLELEETSMLPVNFGETSEKQQIGFLTMLGDVLKNLGPRLLLYWPALLGATMDIIGRAQRRILSSPTSNEDEIEDDVLGDDADAVTDEKASSSKITRSVRQLGLKRFADFFRCPVQYDFTPIMKEAFSNFISPRLEFLDMENTQAPSALLELFYSWTVQGDYVKFLAEFDQRTLPKIYDCMVATNVKPAVVSRIFDIVDHLLAYSITDATISETVVKPHVSLLLANLSTLVERTKDVSSISTPLGQRQISILSQIAQYATDSSQASTLLSLFSPLLRKPAKLVPEKVKADLLKILSNLFALIPDLSDHSSLVYLKTYQLLSQLFQNLRFRPARLGLVSSFHRLAQIDTSLQPLADLLEALNSYSSKRIDEPDFDRRLDAFATLNETLYKSLSVQQWIPLLYNMLHAIQDPTELAVRNNASFSLRHFVDLVTTSTSPEAEAVFLRILFPGLKNGLKSKYEMVRSEVLGVIAYAVTKCDRLSGLQEMRPLLAGGDEEANFFNNIHHVQIHRRSRALRRLADQCDEGHLRSVTLADIFIPLIGNYITSTGSTDRHLVNEAVTTTGRIAKHLAWGAYYSVVQKYLKLSKDKHESERVFVRTLVALLDNFHFPMEDLVLDVEKPLGDDAEDNEDPETINELPDPSIPQDAIPGSLTPKNINRIADVVNMRLLPNLLNHLEKHDASTEDSTRIPIALGIVKVAKHLPASVREPQISRLLTVLSQILRSRSQETRDLTRDTLTRIAVSLGSSYLPLILRELRGALLRGPQLHVLAYTTHALLAHVTTGEHTESFQTLDESVSDVAYVSAEVIFGDSGKDVQAEEFKTKMREVRASSAKGLDSFAIIAKFITPPKISGLLVPLKAIMQQTESIKVMQLVEEVLKRIANGLNANKHLAPPDLLVLCNTLISQNAKFLKQAPSRRKGPMNGDAIVQMKRKISSETDHYANNSFRFVSFGLDLFNTALRRNRLDFRDSNIIARLESMVVVVGNTLYSTSSPVLLLGLKAAAGIAKCPLKALDKSLPVFVQQILDIVKQAGNTESEVVQVAFKSLSTILRDGPTIQVKEKDLIFLLELLSPDLEDPTRQASVFTMLRAIVSRKFVVPEIYDLMDKVSEVMVTSQSPQVQELCRGVLLQFLLDYPQGKGRLRTQMTFFAKNLSYVYESGRKSVMELLGAILTKFDVVLVREYADLLFVALVMVVANDDSAKCRESAAHLIRTLFARLNDDHRMIIMSHLHSWAAQTSQPQLGWVSSQVYGLLIDELKLEASPYIPGLLDDVKAGLDRSAQQLVIVEESDAAQVEMDWQGPYHALIVLSKVLRAFPDLTTKSDKLDWSSVVSHLLFPHAWVRTASCRLLGLLFTAVPVQSPPSDLPDNSPMSKIGMQDVAKKLCLQLKSENLDQALSLQIVKNLFYIGKCFCAIPVADTDAKDGDGLGDEEGEADVIEETGKVNDNPLPWLFSKLSYQAKSAHIARRNRTFSSANWIHQPSSVLRWFAAMSSYMDALPLSNFLVHILTPLYRITEDDTIREPQMDELKILAAELQDLVQSKVGTTKFSNTYNQIRQSALGVRRDRRAARVMQTTTNPEAAAKRKLQRNFIKKDSRKRKNQAFVDRKGGSKRRREL